MNSLNSNMSETIKESIRSYYEQFKSNKWAHFLIPQINYNKGKDFNINKIMESNIKKEPLKSVVSFLAKHLAEEYKQVTDGIEIKPNASKTELATIVIEVVGLSHPYPHGDWPEVNDNKSNNKNTNFSGIDQNDEAEYSTDVTSDESEQSNNSDDDSDEDYEPPTSQKKSNTEQMNTNDSSNKDNESLTPQNTSTPHKEINNITFSETESGASQSQVITPYQKNNNDEINKNPNETLNYDNEIMNVIKSVPVPSIEPETEKIKEPENNDEKDKDDLTEKHITERMKRLSIQVSPKVKQLKTKKKILNKRKKYLVNKTKEVILNENDALQKEIVKLKEEMKEAENQNNTLKLEIEKEKENVLEIHEALDKINDSIKDMGQDEEKRIRYKLTVENGEQKHKIKEITKKYEEQRKRATDKQSEIKDLKKTIEKCLDENAKLKMINEKETALKAKNDGIMNLKDEKIENLERNIGEMEREINKMKMEREEEIPSKSAVNTDPPNSAEDLEALKSEVAKMSDDLILANHEISIRQRQIDEIVKSFSVQITQINLSHMETFSNYKNDSLEIISNLEKEKIDLEKRICNLNQVEENTQTTDNQLQKREIIELRNEKHHLLNKVEQLEAKNQNLPNEIREKDTEIEKLKMELNIMAEQRIEEIKRKTKPPKKKQGLPNNYNFCFMGATIHCLAKILQNEELKEDDIVTNFIKSTKECLNGVKNEEEAENLIADIWEYSKEKWPEYIRNERGSNQEDAAEYMNRLIDETQGIKELFSTIIGANTICTNPDCEMMSVQTKMLKNGYTSAVDTHRNRITLQEIINSEILKSEETVCTTCLQEAEVKYNTIKAPELLLIHYPRNLDDGEKVRTTVTNPNKILELKEKDGIIKYRIKGVMIHRGNEIGSGHYVLNSYDQIKDEWLQIDDSKVIENNQVKGENGQGVVFIFRRVKNENTNYETSNKPNKPSRTNYYTYYPQNGKRDYYNNEGQSQHGRTSPKYKNKRDKSQGKDTSEIPCKYYKNNECEIGYYCPYLHHSCPHYQRGYCKFGDRCRFRHFREYEQNPGNEMNPNHQYYHQQDQNQTNTQA